MDKEDASLDILLIRKPGAYACVKYLLNIESSNLLLWNSYIYLRKIRSSLKKYSGLITSGS